MTLVLYRIDDRLIHGQVVVGWGRPLSVEFIALVDGEVAASHWEQELYRMGVPSGMELVFADVNQAVRQLPAWEADARHGMLLTADIATMAALQQAVPSIDRINIGGIHHRPGRTERLPYLYLSDDELRALRAMEAGGAQITAQDVPTARAVALRSLS
jgi:mannose/fructose/N-acetylgalactosamine-specific phosphotransferase system component IIB